jgi:hypothetical protein
MKRITLSLGALLALLIIAYVVWFARGGNGEAPAIAEQGSLDYSLVSDSPLNGEEPQIVAEQEALAPLPALHMSPSSGLLQRPFEETSYYLPNLLPAGATEMPVYQTSDDFQFSLEDANRFATLFGFKDGAYQERTLIDYPDRTTPYDFFEGSRQLSVFKKMLFYRDHALSDNGEASIVPVAQRVALAETFLHEKGLLDFPYEALWLFGSNVVEFWPVRNGHTVIWPLFQVSVHDSGQIISVGHMPLNQFTAVANYPARSAEEAWQKIISRGIEQSHFSLNPSPDFLVTQPVAYQENPETVPLRWQRTFSEGETVMLYARPKVFVPLSAAELPRITVDHYLLEAPATQLWAIAERPGQPLYLKGIYRDRPGGAVLELVEWHETAVVDYPAYIPDTHANLDNYSWQIFENAIYTLYQGAIRREEDQAFLIRDADERLLLPDAPAELPDDSRVLVYGWSGSEDETGGPFNWHRILLLEGGPFWYIPLPRLIPSVVTESLSIDGQTYWRSSLLDGGPPMEAVPIRQVTIQEIDLLYHVTPILIGLAGPQGRGERSFIIQPLWRFKGETDTNEIIEIYVQAVTGEFIQDEDIFWNDSQ